MRLHSGRGAGQLPGMCHGVAARADHLERMPPGAGASSGDGGCPRSQISESYGDLKEKDQKLPPLLPLCSVCSAASLLPAPLLPLLLVCVVATASRALALLALLLLLELGSSSSPPICCVRSAAA